jgi:DNA topoisomerase I
MIFKNVFLVLLTVLVLVGSAQAAPLCDRLFYHSNKALLYQIEAEKAGLDYLTEFPKSARVTETRKHALGIPADYEVEWLSPNPDSHIQAIAMSPTGRKKYFYHQKWIENVTTNVKYNRVVEFGRALPLIRREVRKNINRPGLSRSRALAALIMLMDQTGIRIGNEESAEESKHFGITTLERRHLKVEDGNYYLKFVGKSGVAHKIEIKDRRLISYFEDSLKEDGSHLFKYRDEDKNLRFFNPSAVNEYLKAVSGIEISAKDFRTWIGTVAAAEYLFKIRNSADAKYKEKAAEYASVRLGNDPGTALKHYIHPRIFNAFIDNETFTNAFHEADGDPEAAVLLILGESNEN